MGQQRYDQHKNEKLNELFRDKPFQGQHPEKASVIILGLDANYDSELTETHPFFQYTEEYHKDGIEFWNTYEVHHPFLLRDYRKSGFMDGWRYHHNFSKLGLESKHAKYISFVELLSVPTTGRTNDEKFFELIEENISHLKWLDDIVFGEAAPEKTILLSGKVIRCMLSLKKKHEVFLWLNKPNCLLPTQFNSVKEIPISNHNKAYKTFHLSHYLTGAQLSDIGDFIKSRIA